MAQQRTPGRESPAEPSEELTPELKKLVSIIRAADSFEDLHKRLKAADEENQSNDKPKGTV